MNRTVAHILRRLDASDEFIAIRQFISPELYDYFAMVLKLTHTTAHHA